MEHFWPVAVVDDTGAAVSGARVCLVAKSTLGTEHHPYPKVAATHNDKGKGKYEPKAPIVPIAGDWVLLVQLKGKAPVVQPLMLSKSAGEFRAKPKPSAVATVVMKETVRKVGASQVMETSFTVKLYPAAEIVFIGGVDYEKRDISTGWLFYKYGLNRAEVLRREKKLHAGTIVTVFNPSAIQRITRVWGGKKWVDVEIAKLGDPKSRVLPPSGSTYVPVKGRDIHIEDFYKYLAEVGKREPKSVKEIGIFSHSYPGGPILYNTGQGTSFSSSPDRDPDDFDARSKDFNATNFARYKEMKDALAPDARFTIWGCSATTLYKRRSLKSLEQIAKGKAETAFFLVNAEYYDHSHTVVQATEQERTSEIRHRWKMDSVFRSGTYPAEAARRLGIEVRSACPGCGSDPTTIDRIEMLMVNLTTYAKVYEYFKKRFSPEWQETKGKWDQGYVDYHKLQSRAPVPKPSFSSAYYLFRVQKVTTTWAMQGASLSFWNGKGIEHPTADVTLSSMEVADLVTKGKKGHLYILTDKDKTKSQAVYAQEDARVFTIKKDAKGNWTVKDKEL
jgi:hypothetical protein